MDSYCGLIIFICCWIPGLDMLPAPTNVTMESYNLRNTLRWNRPVGLEGNVIYIVQYKMDISSSKVDYETICITRDQQCNSSAITYTSCVRVMARLNSSQSEWVTINFDPYRQTIIGPPKTKVSSRSGYLDVSFDGPFLGTDYKSIKETYGKLIYKVKYWKESDPERVLVVETLQNTEILYDLETWTMYCVMVQAYVDEYNIGGEFSPVICKRTTEDGSIPAWKIAMVFIGSMVLSAVLSLLLMFGMIGAYKTTRYICFPSYSLPQHLKEFLSKPFYNTYPPPQPTEECGESCEQLTFISEVTEETIAS